MASTLAILGAVALIIVSVAFILALTMLVLIEARWILRLWVALRRCWSSTIHHLQDAETTRDQAAEPRGHG
jgi:hypothetical protein